MTGSINGYGASGQLPINRTLQQSGQGTPERTTRNPAEQTQDAPQQSSKIPDKTALVKAAFAGHLANTNVSEHGQETKETPRGSLLDIMI